jgi:hypothetical protein
VAYRYFLVQVAEQGRMSELQAIVNAGFDHASMAVQEIVKRLPASEAIQYCRELGLASDYWGHAVRFLDGHPKAVVNPYIQEVMRTCSDPSVRCDCYALYINAKWDDLVDAALVDRDSRAIVVFPNCNHEPTLGYVASTYLRVIKGR